MPTRVRVTDDAGQLMVTIRVDLYLRSGCTLIVWPPRRGRVFQKAQQRLVKEVFCGGQAGSADQAAKPTQPAG
ncbi:hypothetical protein GCM10022226_60250 [Sphaerisporangium flaviroseum]|uniref:Uncharacterized protein n=1 Tax=Sphaerisporangium flaviroseum TaxID=509199 RepID=A0ABP7J000_9ACTN